MADAASPTTATTMATTTSDRSAQHDAAFPTCLAWIERGSVLIRRMNSERIAEDPRLRRLLTATAQDATSTATAMEGEQGIDMMSPPTTTPDLPPKQESFEQVEAVTDKEQLKQEAENAAPNTYRVLLWTYRVHASLQNALQYALFAKASEDGYFVPIAPRVFCVAPAYLTMFTKLFDAHSSTRQWNAAVKLLTQLDTIISKRFENGACVFDCGLFDGVKRLHHQPLVYDEFCDGRIASIAYCRGPIPSMHSAFVIASTVSAWLDLHPNNVGILVAPNNEQMSVFATCCTLYCTDATTFPPHFAKELLDVYQQHIRGAESLTTKLSRTFSGLDAKNVYYAGGNVPKPQSRFVADFTSLLELRDRKLVECADSRDVQERKQKLTGVTVTPAPQRIYIHEIRILTGAVEVTEANKPPAEYTTTDTTAEPPAIESGSVASSLPSPSPLPPRSQPRLSLTPSTPPSIMYRPYFVLQNEKGVLFSSMIHGVKNADLTQGPHIYKVAKPLEQCSDFSIKMYHLPFGRQGELVVDVRLHATLLLDAIGDESMGDVTLSVANGDFDCISAYHVLPKGFAIQIRYAKDASAFPVVTPSEPPAAPAPAAAIATTSTASPAPAPRPPPHRSSFTADTSSRHGSGAASDQAKPVRYDGPPIVSFLLDQPNVRTAFGDVILVKIDVIRRVLRGNHLEIFLLFYVNIGNGFTKVLPYRYLFRYILPEPIRNRMLLMGATEESLNESAPSSFDVGTGMTFDEEYARWLQSIYDTDLNNAQGSFDGELSSHVPVVELQPGPSYRTVSLRIQVGQSEPGSASPPRPPSRTGRPQSRIRGAASSLIQQLPTYIYTSPPPRSSDSTETAVAVATPDCLVCRCGFEDGEEIKSLPCFHSYHSDCIDSWLCLNKHCPVCQFSIDQIE